MSSIKIANLSSAGVELFQDSETFLNELTDQEVSMVNGQGRRFALTGVTSVVTSAISIISQITFSVGISVQSVSVVSSVG